MTAPCRCCGAPVVHRERFTLTSDDGKMYDVIIELCADGCRIEVPS